MLKSILCFCVVSFILFSCAPNNIDNPSVPVIITKETGNEKKNYIDDITFLGESTTYHLKSRGVLSDGKNTKQVWAPKSGTLMLDASIGDCRIIYPDLQKEISLKEALKLKKPKMMLLTFGLNGATGFISRGESYFKFCYQKLIDMIKKSSPETEIIINSCYPIAKNMNMSHYTIDAKTLNSYIDTINLWAKSLAEENALIFTNSASALKDSDGYLSKNLQAEDGYHLNAEAYKAILKYLNKEIQKRLN